MTEAILASTHKTKNYHLPEVIRQKILAGVDNREGKISRRALLYTERLRQRFIMLNGNDGLDGIGNAIN
jgi:hypothetical protein